MCTKEREWHKDREKTRENSWLIPFINDYGSDQIAFDNVERKDNLGDLGVEGPMLNLAQTNKKRERGINSFDSWQGSVADSCAYKKKSSGSENDGEFLNQLR
jgi:hypothetical protein